MSKARSQTRTSAENGITGGSEGEGGDAIGRIREILLGDSQRSLEVRLLEVEERFQAQFDQMREEMAGRLQEIHRLLQGGDHSVRDLGQALGSVQEQAERAEQAMRSRFEQQEATWTERTQRMQAEVSRSLEAAKQDLRGEHTDRRELAELLRQIATRLDEPSNGNGDG